MMSGGVRRIVVMGVSGSGKSAIGCALAVRLGWRFIEADDLHPAVNIVKMSNGVPLTDHDREPWLAEVARQLASGCHAIAACSALRQSYRRTIANTAQGAFFVHLAVPRAMLAARMQARSGHFMPASLLNSQLATLEPLAPGEWGITVDGARELDDVVAELADRITN